MKPLVCRTRKRKELTVETVAEGSLLRDLKDNRFIGELPELINSRISFKGTGNIFFCEKGVVLRDSKLLFNGSDSLICLSGSRHAYKLDVAIYSSSVFAIGEGCYINGVLHAIPSERCNIVIGKGGLLSFGIWMRTADPHLVYDADSKGRINQSKDVMIGDHVWIGQSSIILKGSQIGSGSIVGAGSIVAGKRIPSNTSWGGNPAKMIKENVIWDGRCVHAFSECDSARYETCPDESFESFDFRKTTNGEGLSELSRQLHQLNTPKEKLALLQKTIVSDCRKDRFAIVDKSCSVDAARPVPHWFGQCVRRLFSGNG